MTEKFVDIPTFVDNRLRAATTTIPADRKHVSLVERLSGSFPAYRDYVQALVEYRNTSPTQRSSEKLVELRYQAEDSGLTQRQILAAKKRAEGIYDSWLRIKHESQVQPNPMDIHGGTDPNVFLDDGSHRKGLGYIQSQQEE